MNISGECRACEINRRLEKSFIFKPGQGKNMQLTSVCNHSSWKTITARYELTGSLMFIILLTAPFYGNAQTVTFSGKDVPLKVIFASIKNQTGVVFFYDEKLIKESKPVTVSLINTPLKTALDEIFKNQTLYMGIRR